MQSWSKVNGNNVLKDVSVRLVKQHSVVPALLFAGHAALPALDRTEQVRNHVTLIPKKGRDTDDIKTFRSMFKNANR